MKGRISRLNFLLVGMRGPSLSRQSGRRLEEAQVRQFNGKYAVDVLWTIPPSTLRASVQHRTSTMFGLAMISFTFPAKAMASSSQMQITTAHLASHGSKLYGTFRTTI